MNFHHSGMLCIGIFCSAITVVFAQPYDYRHEKRLIDGMIYEYKPIVVRDRNKEPDRYDHQISVKESPGGEIIFLQRIGFDPGCDGNTPAIQIVDIPRMGSNKKDRFIAFCGSYGGPSITMRFYKPGHGMMHTIEFGRNTPNLHHNNVSTDAIIYKKIWVQSIIVYYPLIHELKSNGSFIVSRTLFTDEKYKTFLEEEYYSSDKFTNENERMSMEIEKAIILALAGDAHGFCLQEKKIDIPELRKDLTKETNIAYPPCEDA